MQGGADDEIVARFSNLAGQAADGALDYWAQDPHGRLALIIILDQLSRSVWQDGARAHAQDVRALSLVSEGFSNAHYSSLETPWFQVVYGLPLGHCEGSGHVERLDLLIGVREAIEATAPVPLRPIYVSLVDQARDVRKVIVAFGRHPHRNAVLGRTSTAAEETYIANSEFPHLRAFRKDQRPRFLNCLVALKPRSVSVSRSSVRWSAHRAWQVL